MKTLIFDLDGTLIQLQSDFVCFADVDQLTLLRQQYNFALVSGSSRAEVLWALEKTRLLPLFNERLVIGFEDTQSEKASGKPFQKIRERLEGDAVMIGDSLSDEIGSAIAGILFVKIETRQTVQEQRNELISAIGRGMAILDKKDGLLIKQKKQG